MYDEPCRVAGVRHVPTAAGPVWKTTDLSSATRYWLRLEPPRMASIRRGEPGAVECVVGHVRGRILPYPDRGPLALATLSERVSADRGLHLEQFGSSPSGFAGGGLAATGLGCGPAVS